MDNRSEVRDFLISRRGKVTPEQVGLAAGVGARRVKGLRRGEAAQLVGVSVEYHTQLERGNIRGASIVAANCLGRAPIAGLDTGVSVVFDHRDPRMVTQIGGVRVN